MFYSGRSHAAAIAALSITILSSCARGPAPVGPPEIDASDAGSQAMEMYDTNKDGKIADDELVKAAGINAALSRIDKNGDKAVTADEVAARVQVWQGGGLGLMSFPFKVTMNGSPLYDATVTFEPEPFLGDQIQAGLSKTGVHGDGGATIPKENRPSPQTPPGMHLGLYRVKISKVENGKETIPAKYNEITILGQEVAMDVSEIANNRVVYALTSK